MCGSCLDPVQLRTGALMVILPFLAGIEQAPTAAGGRRLVLRPKKSLAAVLTLFCAIEMAYVAEAWWRHRMPLRNIPPNLSLAAGRAFRDAFQREALITLAFPTLLACRAFSRQPWVAVGVAKVGAGLGALIGAHFALGGHADRGQMAGFGAGAGAAVTLLALLGTQLARACVPRPQSRLMRAVGLIGQVLAGALAGAIALMAHADGWRSMFRL